MPAGTQASIFLIDDDNDDGIRLGFQPRVMHSIRTEGCQLLDIINPMMMSLDLMEKSTLLCILVLPFHM